MRILICNKFWYRRGGDCVYSLNLERLLRSKGNETAVFAMQYSGNEESEWSRFFPPEVGFDGLASKLRYAGRCLGYGGVVSRFRAVVSGFRPDVVHLNNIHSQLSPVIAAEAFRLGIPVVWTLHDYKLLCPRYDCLRKGVEACESCFTNKCGVLRHSCMKNSAAASLVAWAEAVKWNRSRLDRYTSRFICPSSFIARKMEEGGFSGGKLVTLCNFIDVGQCRRDDYAGRGDYYCYVGRLSSEKGVRTLVEAAASLPYRLVVVGDGPLAGSLPPAGNIEYVGRKDWEGIKEIAGKARFMVLPSECYENNPLSVIESLCLGTPVLGALAGGIPELIEPGVSGLCFKSGDPASLAEGIEKMYGMEFDYGAIAAASCARFSEETYYDALMKIYKDIKI